MPIRPYNQTDEDDPYSNAGGGSDSTAVDPNDPPASAAPDTNTASSQPAPYKPPKTVATPGSEGDGHAVRTFAQMEAEGQARPPAPPPPQIGPESAPAGAPAGTGGYNMGTADASPATDNMVSGAMVTDPAGIATDTEGGYTPGRIAGETSAQGTHLPSSVDSILPLLTGKATGNDPSALEQATTAKTLAQLNGSSPYDSEEVKNEYNWLSGNIDDQFANDVRNTDDSFAQRGLYGSAGKDFHSGRLSDLNVGKRSAKEDLGRSLAEKYATTKGQYDANAITQGQQGVNAQNANQQDWLHSLMGYGNDAYNHDLQSAEFQQRQNESEQDYMLRLLQMGYGA